MTGLDECPEKFRGPVQAMLAEFSKNPAYVGTLLHGGGPLTNRRQMSVLAIVDAPVWFTGKQRSGGDVLDISLRSLQEVTTALLTTNDAALIRGLAYSTPLGEATLRIGMLQEIARSVWNSGPSPTPELRRMLIREKYCNMIGELDTRTETAAEFAYLAAWLTHRAVGDLYRAYGWHSVPADECLADLRGRSPDAATFLEHALSARSADAALPALHELVDFTLQPWGGLAPKEWSVRDRTMAIHSWNESAGQFEEHPPYNPADYQLPPDAFKIGINDWVADGQEFEELSSEAFKRGVEFFYWDDPANPPLMYVNDVVEKVVREYATRKHILGIVVFGSHGNGSRPPRLDSDVDLFVITDRTGIIHEKRIVDGVAIGFQFVNFTDLYEGTLSQRQTGFWRGMKESKILFSRHPSVPLMQALASATFEAGMKLLSQRDLVLRMDRLETLLADGDWLLKKSDIPSLLLSDNALFCTAIQDWFRMNALLDTKRTYVMQEIAARDPELHRLMIDYLSNHDPATKHYSLRSIVLHIEKPFGGPLPAEWAIPVPGAAGAS